MARLGLAIGTLSGAALAYQILLIRLFSITDWHHLAFLVISLALLGFGASGTLLALAREALLHRFELVAAIAAAAFGATSFGAFVISQRIELNSLEMFWSLRQAGLLFALYLLFAIPFFCAATAIGLALTRFGADSPRLYRADLAGAGVGAAAVIALLFVFHPLTALQIIAVVGLASAMLFSTRVTIVLISLAGIAGVFVARPLTEPLRMSQFKELSHAMRIPGTRVVDERSSPMALLTSVASPMVPFRHAPGLSLAFSGEIQDQIGIFADGGGMTPVTVWDGDASSVAWLGFTTTAAAYHAGTPKRRVAVIGAGGGTEVVSALVHGAEEVTAVELNRQMVDLVAERFASESGNLYRHPRVRVRTSEARRFIRETGEHFDLIQLALVGSPASSAAGVQALSESYLYTVEAMEEMLGRLTPGGYLVITRWMQTPPREVVKLIATVVAAESNRGNDPASRFALLRGWNTATLVVKNGDIGPAEVEALRQFCDDRSFDLDYAPGVRREETNRFNLLEDSQLFDAATALLRDPEDFHRRYKFNVRPATDERPYFFHSLRWSVLPELLRMRARGGMPLLEWGYLVLVAALLQAAVAAFLLILLPLLLGRRREKGGSSTPRLIAYFGSIGLAFLFIEIAFMQRLTLLLGNPLYAIAVVLASFLLFAGLGSGFSARIEDARLAIVPVIVAIGALVTLVGARALTNLALAMPDPAKVAVSVVLVAPLAFVMGMPFPLALRRLAAEDPAAIPWAWGINGTASVLSSMLATLVAVHLGFSAVVAMAAALYGVAAVAARR